VIRGPLIFFPPQSIPSWKDVLFSPRRPRQHASSPLLDPCPRHGLFCRLFGPRVLFRCCAFEQDVSTSFLFFLFSPSFLAFGLFWLPFAWDLTERVGVALSSGYFFFQILQILGPVSLNSKARFSIFFWVHRGRIPPTPPRIRLRLLSLRVRGFRRLPP